MTAVDLEAAPATEPRQRALATSLILATALLAGGALRIVGITAKRNMTHDEAISYLAATGHLAEYDRILAERRPPYGTWAKASEWKRLLRIETPLCLGTIGHDLAHYDIHPPLYFWLLHLWLLAFGTHVWIGPALNVVLFGIGTGLLFALARHVLRGTVPAAAVTLLWSVSPTVIPSAWVARQYDLFAAASILFVWQTLRCSAARTPRWLRSCLLLGLTTALGLLSHYHFVILLAAAAVLLPLRHGWAGRRRVLRAWAALAAGCALAAALHPEFRQSVGRAKLQAQSWSVGEFQHRVPLVFERYAEFFLDSRMFGNAPRHYVDYAVCSLIILTIAALVLLRARPGRGHGRDPGSEHRDALYVVGLLLTTAAAHIGLYLSCISPRHAIAAMHPAMVWPLLAFVPVLALHFLKRGRGVAGAALALILLAGSGRQAGNQHQVAARFADPEPAFRQAQRIVVDKVERGWFPRFFWFFPDDMPVFAGDPAYLLEHAAAWLPELHRTNLYIGAKPERGILERLLPRYELREFGTGVWGVGFICRVTERGG